MSRTPCLTDLSLGAAEEEGAQHRAELPDHHVLLLFGQLHLP